MPWAEDAIITLLNSPTSLDAMCMARQRNSNGLDFSTGLQHTEKEGIYDDNTSQDSFLQTIYQEELHDTILSPSDHDLSYISSSSKHHHISSPSHHHQTSTRDHRTTLPVSSSLSSRGGFKLKHSSKQPSFSRQEQDNINHSGHLRTSKDNRNLQNDHEPSSSQKQTSRELSSTRLRLQGQLGTIHELETKIHEKQLEIDHWKNKVILQQKQLKSTLFIKTHKKVQRNNTHVVQLQSYKKSEETLTIQISELLQEITSLKVRQQHLKESNGMTRQRYRELQETCTTQQTTIKLNEKNIQRLRAKISSQKRKLKLYAPSKELIDNLPSTRQLLSTLESQTQRQSLVVKESTSVRKQFQSELLVTTPLEQSSTAHSEKSIKEHEITIPHQVISTDNEPRSPLLYNSHTSFGIPPENELLLESVSSSSSSSSNGRPSQSRALRQVYHRVYGKTNCWD